jgi:hypothetical protein
MVDFAPRVAFALRNSTCARTVLHVPGWFNDERFSWRLSGTPRSMAPLASALFGKYGLRLAAYKLGQEPAQAERLDFAGMYRWSDQPPVWLDHFRTFARGLAAPVPPVGSRFDLLFVRRGVPNADAPPCKRPTYCNSGAARRRLPASFFDGASAFITAQRVRGEIAVLEGLSLVEQVRLFAQAPVIVAMHGAGLSNLLFASSGAVLVEVGLRGNRCYQRLAAKMGVAYFHTPHGKRGFSREVDKVVRKALSAARKRLRLAPVLAAS